MHQAPLSKQAVQKLAAQQAQSAGTSLTVGNVAYSQMEELQQFAKDSPAGRHWVERCAGASSPIAQAACSGAHCPPRPCASTGCIVCPCNGMYAQMRQLVKAETGQGHQPGTAIAQNIKVVHQAPLSKQPVPKPAAHQVNLQAQASQLVLTSAHTHRCNSLPNKREAKGNRRANPAGKRCTGQ